MKINPISINNVISRYQNMKPNTNATVPAFSDSFEPSEQAQQFSKAVKQVSRSIEEPTNFEKVRYCKIEAQLKSGTYSVDGQEVAKKIFESIVEMDA